MASQPIFQFYAELNDYEPKMWRRFQVAGNITMARLGYTIMTMYEMKASHLFCFDFPIDKYFRAAMLENFSEAEINKALAETDYLRKENKNWHFEILTEETDDDDDDDDDDDLSEKTFDAAKTLLKDVRYRVNEAMTFTYDYGDGWQVSVTLEKIFDDKELPISQLPRVLEGAGFGIIEDCGGAGGLEDLAKAYQKKEGNAYEEYCEWLGQDDLDLSAFDIDDMNFRLKKVPRIYFGLYEMGYDLTGKSLDILERKYLKSE